MRSEQQIKDKIKELEAIIESHKKSLSIESSIDTVLIKQLIKELKWVLGIEEDL